MKLYHSPLRRVFFPILILILAVSLSGCDNPQAQTGLVRVRILADGGEREVQMTAGNTVQDALAEAGVTPGELDRLDPVAYTVLTADIDVRLVRVREEFVVEQVVILYDEKVLRNESLPEGKEYSIQAGQNGQQELTTRRVFEDGVEVSSSVVKALVVREAIPQIKMVGVQKPFAPVAITGRLVYLVDGDAWMMDGSTGNRLPVVTTGDLDGRVFSLSPDGDWLLYTRRSQIEGVINSLWAVKLDDPASPGSLTVDLKVTNVVHYAGWHPRSAYTLAYSTVEPRAAAPGWQANNDLSMLSLSNNGTLRPLPPVLETNMGGNYGWWGMSFAWAPDGSRLAYTRPDGVGLLDVEGGLLQAVLDDVPLLTRGDWAWVPGLSWGPDGKMLFTVSHAPAPGISSLEESPLFDLTAVPLEGGSPVNLATKVGMFAYPIASAFRYLKSGEINYQVAYLQAQNPTQSESSRYLVMVVDRDGSNRRRVFPVEGSSGLEPQNHWGVWSPEALQETGNWVLAVIYAGNLWMIDTANGEAWQITGDSLVSRVDWR